MGEDQKGVLVRSVQPISFAHGHLLPGDVLMAFDGIEVACGELLSSIKAAGLLDLEVTACRSCILKLGPRALLTPFQLPPTPCADGTVPLLSGNRIEFFLTYPAHIATMFSSLSIILQTARCPSCPASALPSPTSPPRSSRARWPRWMCCATASPCAWKSR